MNRRRKFAIAFASLAMITTIILGSNQDASAWQPASLSVDGDGCIFATVTAHNSEGEPATVQGGNLWAKGTTIPAHGTKSMRVTKSGTYTLTVNYPSDRTLRTSSIKVTIPDCPPPPTTQPPPPPTTTPPPPPTEPPPPVTEPPVEPPSSSVPPVTEQCDANPVVVCTPAKFAG